MNNEAKIPDYPGGTMFLPAMEIPGFRTQKAIERGVEKNLLFTTWGGIGDQICAEPTLRFAVDTFKNCDVSLATEHPYFFKHLSFKKVIDTKKERYDANDYLVFQTITHPETLTWQFMGHLVTNCVDFPSLCALRCQLPIAYKKVKLVPDFLDNEILEALAKDEDTVLIHAGRHWESKTFPAEWWEQVATEIDHLGLKPVLIGKDDVDSNVGTVRMRTGAALDLRNKCTLNETIWLVQNCPVLVCNDSSPIHMAAPGQAWIGCIATVKHPDYIFHWREGGWAWRMENLSLGGFWNEIDYCPNKQNKLELDKCDVDLLKTWLPSPQSVAEWAYTRRESD